MSPSLARFANRFGGILDQIQEDLNELILVAENRRKRGIIVFMKADMARKPGLGHFLDVVEHGVNIDFFALDGRFFGKRAHPVDKLHNPVGLLANEPRQHAISVGRVGFQKLCGAANTRQRILHFMRENRCHRGDRSPGAAMS